MNTENQINEIIENFDWLRVHNHMTHTNWTWASARTPSGPTVPSFPKLISHATKLLQAVAESPEKITWTASGGFFALKFNGILRLHFEITSWGADPDDE